MKNGVTAPVLNEPPPAVSVSGLVKSFGPVEVLRDLELLVAPGEITALLGPSGCGKTTLLRLVAGFDRPDAGVVALADRIVSGPRSWVPAHRRGIGYVPQDGVLFPHLTVAGNVGFALRSDTSKAERIAAMLDLVDLRGHERRMPHELSGGQQQRVAIARALAPAPGLVLLDEPFNALDADLRRTLCAEVRRILKRAGAAALMVTHDRDEAFSVSDRVAAMRGGRIVQWGTASAFYREPVDLQVARLAGPVVCLDGHLAGRLVETPLGCVAAMNPQGLDDGPVVAMLRPEQIVAAGDEGGTIATVRSTTMRGPLLWLDIECVSRVGPLRLCACWLAAHQPADGVTIAVRASGSAVVYPRSA